jgi:hypothetical protein
MTSKIDKLCKQINSLKIKEILEKGTIGCKCLEKKCDIDALWRWGDENYCDIHLPFKAKLLFVKNQWEITEEEIEESESEEEYTGELNSESENSDDEKSEDYDGNSEDYDGNSDDENIEESEYESD